MNAANDFAELISTKDAIITELKAKGSDISYNDGLKKVPSEINKLNVAPSYEDWFLTRELVKVYFDSNAMSLYNFRSILQAYVTLETLPDTMFSNCSSMVRLDLPNFKSGSNTIKHMCTGCSSLELLVLGSKENPFDGSDGLLSDNLYFTYYAPRSSIIVYLDSSAEIFDDLVDDFYHSFAVNADLDACYAYKVGDDYIYKLYDSIEGEWIDITEEEIFDGYDVHSIGPSMLTNE